MQDVIDAEGGTLSGRERERESPGIRKLEKKKKYCTRLLKNKKITSVKAVVDDEDVIKMT